MPIRMVGLAELAARKRSNRKEGVRGMKGATLQGIPAMSAQVRFRLSSIVAILLFLVRVVAAQEAKPADPPDEATAQQEQS
jgi:hypothetical protein